VIKERITKSPRLYSALLGSIVAFIGVVKYGIDIWPGWPNMFAITQNLSNPHASPILAGDQDYILSSPTSALLLGVIPGSNQFVFVSGSVVLALFALLLPFLSPRISHSKDKARILFIFMAGGALLPLLLTWIGSYDPMTVIGLTLALGFRQRTISLAGWILTGFNHSTLGIISLAAVAVILWASPAESTKSDRVKPLLIGALGLFIGFFLNAILINFWGGATSRWELFRGYPFSFYINNTIAAMPMLIFSALGVGWLVLLRPRWLKLPATKALILIGLLLPIALSVTALDQTRVSTLAMFAPIFLFVEKGTNLLARKELRTTWKSLSIAGIIIPIPIYWVGVLEQNGWQSILSWTSNFL